jgi:hypothetical protein
MIAGAGIYVREILSGVLRPDAATADDGTVSCFASARAHGIGQCTRLSSELGVVDNISLGND